MNYQTLAVEPQGEHILLVTLNRPQVLNALNTQMGKDQLDLWTRLTAEPGTTALRRCSPARAIARSAPAADLKERDGMTETVWRAQHEIFERAFMALMELPLPIIAAVNGARVRRRAGDGAVLRLHLRRAQRAHGAVRKCGSA